VWLIANATALRVSADTRPAGASRTTTAAVADPPSGEVPTTEPVSPHTATASDTAVPSDTALSNNAAPASIAPRTSAGDTVGNQESKDSIAPSTARVPQDPKTYGLWILAPALVAIILAIFTRQVIPALVVGILVGAYMMLPCRPVGDPMTQANPLVGGFRLAIETYILGVIHNNPSSDKALGRIMVIVFTLVIGFMVGVIGHNGGTRGLVRVVTGESQSQRRGALTSWFAGMVVFFDDYANAMIVGPTMRPVFDRLKLSRAKLAYIVDSTAAPVASLALIGTWVGAEIGFIQDGLNHVAAAGAPAFLLNQNGTLPKGMEAFIASIPYRFYPILALFLVFLVSLTGRDFGPMKRAQRRAAGLLDDEGADSKAQGSVTASLEALPQSTTTTEPPARWWLGLIPVLVLIFTTIVVLVVNGYGSDATMKSISALDAQGASVWASTPWWGKVSQVISNANPYDSILYGAILSAFAAVLLTIGARAVSTVKSINAGVDGMCRMFPAVVILVLAWSLSQLLSDLQLGAVAVEHLNKAHFDMHWLPLAVFITAGVISFSTGTSWGTMGILCPAVVEIAARLGGSIEASEAMSLFYASIGSVLAGAVFGDHCSPISDTTVLSAIASECTLEEHVWTQLPYALVAALAAMAVGDVMSSAYNHPWYEALGAGALVLTLIVFIVGRTSKPPEPAPPTPEYT